MRKFRLKALKHFERRLMPWWGADLSDIDFENIYYFIRSTEKQAANWDELPEDIKGTWDKLGIPEAEKKYRRGLRPALSEVVYHKIKQELDDMGVLFTDMDSALRDHPDLVKEYFGTLILPNDNKFGPRELGRLVRWTFIYVLPGVHVDILLQAYFRINAENMGQFERTLIIADEGSYVHYVEGCSAPIYTTDSLHSAVVEIIAKKGARVRYTTIQNWSTNVYNLVTKRAAAYEDAVMEWIDGNIGSVTMKYPRSTCSAGALRGEVLSVVYAGKGMHTDAGGKAIHAAPTSTSVLTSKSVSKDEVHRLPRPRPGRTGGRPRQVERPVRRADPRRGVAVGHVSVRRGRGGDRAARSRGERVADRRGPALLPDEPGPVRGRGERHDREWVHRADHPRAADGVRRRAQPPDRAPDGRRDRLDPPRRARAPVPRIVEPGGPR